MIYTLFQKGHCWPVLTVNCNFQNTFLGKNSWKQFNNWKKSFLHTIIGAKLGQNMCMCWHVCIEHSHFYLHYCHPRIRDMVLYYTFWGKFADKTKCKIRIWKPETEKIAIHVLALILYMWLQRKLILIQQSCPLPFPLLEWWSGHF